MRVAASMGGCGGSCHGSRGCGAVAGGGGGRRGSMDEAALDVVVMGTVLLDGDLYPVYAGAVAGMLSKGD